MGEAHICGGFGVIQKRVVLPAVVRVDVGSVGKKLHGDVALEVRDAAIDTRHWEGLLGGYLPLALVRFLSVTGANPGGAGGCILPDGGVAAGGLAGA